jgi:hypothetical protein
MSYQNVLETIYPLNFCCFRVHPIDHIIIANACKRFLMLRAKKVKQVYSPISIILTPPIKIDVKSRLQTGLNQAKTL